MKALESKNYDYMLFRSFLGILLFVLAIQISESTLFAQLENPAQVQSLREQTSFTVKNRVNTLLGRYCGEACQIIDVEVDLQESLPQIDDLGFENSQTNNEGQFFVNQVNIRVQVDERVTSVNRERLQNILINHLSNIGFRADIIWVPVEIPQIGQSAAIEEELKQRLRNNVSNAIRKVISNYCPEACVLSYVTVDGRLISPDEASGLSPREVLKDNTGRAILRIDGIEVVVGLDQALGGNAHNRITNVMKNRTQFVEKVTITPTSIEFPESFAMRQRRLDSESDDPYGLEKLRRTLKLFRDLAGTKEIISKEENTQATDNGMDWWQYIIILLVLIGSIYGFMRYKGVQRDAELMMAAAGAKHFEQDDEDLERSELNTQENGKRKDSSDMVDRIRNKDLRDELIEIFLDAPKVAKETFSRMLREEEIEHTAKYVKIFGHMIVFELLGDPNLERELYELSEYYHKSNYEFSLEEEYKHLLNLKTKVTANEIRVLTTKRSDKFDFLLKLDPTQIFNLISDENPQVQSIVLTQMDHKRRRIVFNSFEGDPRVSLMRELCRADAIPKEYLNNVAKALTKKVSSKPEFDTENLRSSDIILDLMERASLEEQKRLMSNLLQLNPEAARAIKLKLVTVELMPFLKDGHLLEMILGLDREDLLTFLMGGPEHIRELLLTKAPEELAESWNEDLENLAGVDDAKFRLVEMKILGRIRNLASNGAINLMDINDMIFDSNEEEQVADEVEHIQQVEHMIA